MKNEQLLMDLTDEQCEKVVGGVGRGEESGANTSAGFVGWFGGPPGSGHGLFNAGHSPTFFTTKSGVTVWVPATPGHG